MLVWSAVFMAISCVTGAFAFGEITARPPVAAKLSFYIFAILSGLALFGHLATQRMDRAGGKTIATRRKS